MEWSDFWTMLLQALIFAFLVSMVIGFVVGGVIEFCRDEQVKREQKKRRDSIR